jgi:hypothetical protein
MNRLVTKAYLLFALTMLSLPTAAHALNVPMPSAGGTLTIGMVTGDGRPWAAFKSAAGACTFTLLGNSAGLTSFVQVFGSSGNDTINIVSSGSTTICAFTFTPVVLHGNFIDVSAGGGADFVGGRGRNMDCGGGSDLAIGASGTTVNIWGSTGNDVLFGGATLLHGGDNPDTLCTITGTLPDWFGGSDAAIDTGCGAFRSSVGVDNINTNACPAACRLF